MSASEMPVPETRAGYVALVGRPNVGKSTLLNAFTGERLSIVTPRAQTTRDRVLGIYTDAIAQIVFVDTPGLLEPRYLLQRSMLDVAVAALEEADVVLLLLDATRPEETPGAEVLARLVRRPERVLAVINKTDAAPAGSVASLTRWAADRWPRPAVPISAASGHGVAELRDRLREMLPASPFLYPPDEIAVQPLRFFVAELIRETIFEHYAEEVPYGTAVKIEEFRESEEPLYIRATVYVERDSQKAILIGKGGTAIKRLGSESRQKIEALVDAPVFLDLWVKPLAGWRRKADALRRLGYPVPQGSTAAARKPGRGRGSRA